MSTPSSPTPDAGARVLGDATPRAPEFFSLNGSKAHRRNGIGSHHSALSKTDEWLTPPEIIQALGPFELDPCAPELRPWPTAHVHFTKIDDGMARQWIGRVWCNPPYGAQTAIWIRKLSEHGNGIALIFARTETDCWHRYVWPRATALVFLRGRINFHHVTGQRANKNSGAPSALIAYGGENAEALLFACKTSIPGHFVALRPFGKLVYQHPEFDLCGSNLSSHPNENMSAERPSEIPSQPYLLNATSGEQTPTAHVAHPCGTYAGDAMRGSAISRWKTCGCSRAIS
jgi:hypothetical protein